MCDGRKRREPVHEAGVEDIYAWWCMFAETTRPNSVICQEWVHEHKLREPRQYIEGRESFHAIAETDEMYRAWCGNPSKARTTVNQCSHLNEEAPARAHSEELSRPSSSSASSSLTTSSHPHSSGSDSGLESKWAHLGASAVSSQAMTHCPAPPNSERTAAAAKDGTTGGSGEGTGRWQAVGKVKVRLVLVVGVEGAGHKLLASVLDKASDFVFQKGASPEIFLTASSSSSSPSSAFVGSKHPESNPRVLAQRLRKDKDVKQIMARAAFTTLKTVAFVGETFPASSALTLSSASPRPFLHHPDLLAFANLKYHGFDPVFLFLRRHLGMAALSNLRAHSQTQRRQQVSAQGAG
eukprot:CAMPEP_0171938566 /NCGR_PEP_ID=MMETSP0993-20121228/35587_1 /TAXON_ID=483369 /ORGANISM="non described non described, Strain CCMP2098" /LENGTH=351 /DNA_ID=CAMNT_0012580187 /DNA_START=129 /DNA_END=1180 /DNA_ORIENTATION=+